MIDKQGFRLNVGIILVNQQNRLFWGRRPGAADAWQFPQGGIHESESVETAMFRELEEELGLSAVHVKIRAITKNWLTYFLPEQFRRHADKPLCIGQKQKWYLLELVDDESCIHFDHTPTPEFIEWLWVDYWLPAEKVVSFKRKVYREVLKEFEPILFDKIKTPEMN